MAKATTAAGLLAAAEALSVPERAALIAGLVEANPLVGVNRGSQVLGVQPPNFGRHKAGLTEIPIEGGKSVYVKAQVEELAARMREAREARK